MKRILASALILSSFSLVTLVGCEEKTEVKDVKTIKTPDGDKKETTSVKTEATGDQKAPEPVKAP